jgi:hypothetical protein
MRVGYQINGEKALAIRMRRECGTGEFSRDMAESDNGEE